ncbi:MAG: glycosyl transferase [Leptospiraceae bacterium]|nr:glycosyl transferase [Leptospiraceae bacterium]
MYNYCTLFNSIYLTRGLALYESLKKHSAAFHLYIFAFDDRCYQLLKKLNLSNATIISLQEFEDEALLKIKNSRSVGEYCWTCTPSSIKYAIETYRLTHCTYLDADLYFFSDPSTLIEEMDSNSVSIIEHRYTPDYDQTKASGKYCVQFMTFKNDDNGMIVLNWWREACIDWCYARFENGKFGDQKYLDDWTKKFEGVYELKNLGGGVAPWNIQQYQLFNNDNQILGVELSSKKEFNLIFYHFHMFKFLEYNQVDLGYYKFTEQHIEIIYKPYIVHLYKIKMLISEYDSTYDYQGTEKKMVNLISKLKVLKRVLFGYYNIFSLKKFI